MRNQFGQGSFGHKDQKPRGFQYPKVKQADASPVSRARTVITRKKSPTGGPYFIQGIHASDLEWRTYITLHKLGWTDANIQFQTSVLGGRMPGGQVLDFVLYGFGDVTVIPVNGDYWHKGGIKGELTLYNEQIIQSVMPSARIVPLYGADLATDEVAFATLSRRVGRGR